MDRQKCKNALISGAISGCITAVTFQPFEVIKTRLQQSSNLNRSSLTIIKQAINQNGVFVLWNGLSPALYRSVPVVSVYFLSIEMLRNMSIFKTENKGYKMFLSFSTGAIARAFSDISVYPLSLIKTRYESDYYKYANLKSAFQNIIKNEGFMGLFKGLNATLIRDINYSGFYYMFYILLKNDNSTTQQIAASALLSGFLACFITQPPDVIRARMQLNQSQCDTLIKTIRVIFSENGMKGFFVGFVPRATRRILISVFSWTVFEKLSLKSS